MSTKASRSNRRERRAGRALPAPAPARYWYGVERANQTTRRHLRVSVRATRYAGTGQEVIVDNGGTRSVASAHLSSRCLFLVCIGRSAGDLMCWYRSAETVGATSFALSTKELLVLSC